MCVQNSRKFKYLGITFLSEGTAGLFVGSEETERTDFNLSIFKSPKTFLFLEKGSYVNTISVFPNVNVTASSENDFVDPKVICLCGGEYCLSPFSDCFKVGVSIYHQIHFKYDPSLTTLLSQGGSITIYVCDTTPTFYPYVFLDRDLDLTFYSANDKEQVIGVQYFKDRSSTSSLTLNSISAYVLLTNTKSIHIKSLTMFNSTISQMETDYNTYSLYAVDLFSDISSLMKSCFKSSPIIIQGSAKVICNLTYNEFMFSSHSVEVNGITLTKKALTTPTIEFDILKGKNVFMLNESTFISDVIFNFWDTEYQKTEVEIMESFQIAKPYYSYINFQEGTELFGLKMKDKIKIESYASSLQDFAPSIRFGNHSLEVDFSTIIPVPSTSEISSSSPSKNLVGLIIGITAGGFIVLAIIILIPIIFVYRKKKNIFVNIVDISHSNSIDENQTDLNPKSAVVQRLVF